MINTAEYFYGTNRTCTEYSEVRVRFSGIGTYLSITELSFRKVPY